MIRLILFLSICITLNSFAQTSDLKKKCEKLPGTLFDDSNNECKCFGEPFDLKNQTCVIKNSSYEIMDKDKVPACNSASEFKPNIESRGTLYATPVGGDGAVAFTFEFNKQKSYAIISPSNYGTINLITHDYNGAAALNFSSIDQVALKLASGVGLGDADLETFKAALIEPLKKNLNPEKIKSNKSKCAEYSSEDGSNIAKLKGSDSFGESPKSVCLEDGTHLVINTAECKCDTGDNVNLNSEMPTKCQNLNKSNTNSKSKSNISIED